MFAVFRKIKPLDVTEPAVIEPAPAHHDLRAAVDSIGKQASK